MTTHTLYLVGETNTPVFCGGFQTKEAAMEEGARRKASFWPANPNGIFFSYYVA